LEISKVARNGQGDFGTAICRVKWKSLIRRFWHFRISFKIGEAKEKAAEKCNNHQVKNRSEENCAANQSEQKEIHKNLTFALFEWVKPIPQDRCQNENWRKVLP